MSYKFNEIDYNNVVDYFINNHNNTDKAVSNALNLSIWYVSYLIDLYLSKKQNYMGVVPKPKGVSGPKGKTIKAFDSDNNLIGIYPSVRICSESLNICKYTISKYLRCLQSHTRQGYSFEYVKKN
jgi:hypothetical protein